MMEHQNWIFPFRDIPEQLGNQLYSCFILDRKVIEDEKPIGKKHNWNCYYFPHLLNSTYGFGLFKFPHL